MIQMHHVTFTHLSSASPSGFMSSSLLKDSLLEADESRLHNRTLWKVENLNQGNQNYKNSNLNHKHKESKVSDLSNNSYTMLHISLLLKV